MARGDGGAESGFATVDAIVGLTVLALAISLALQSLDVSRRLAARSLEVRRASSLLQYLVDAGSTRIGPHTGSLGPFRYSLSVEPLPADPQAPAVRLCRRTADVSDSQSGRRYRLEMTDFCVPPEQLP